MKPSCPFVAQRGMKMAAAPFMGCDWRRHKACGYLPLMMYFQVKIQVEVKVYEKKY
ncbi:MAG: hypothetical protein HZB79_05065 [Deltaproteobacteria bacterium]|nr:hypothetical protein [Deltaproteobacteria bacterium]